MQIDNFWTFVNTMGKRSKWYTHFGEQGPRIRQAEELCIECFPEACDWFILDKSTKKPTNMHAIFQLLTSVAFGAYAGTGLPQNMQNRRLVPEEVALNIGEENFRYILYQKPPLGYKTFIWEFTDKDCFFQIPSHEHIATTLRTHYTDNGSGKQHEKVVCGAICFFRNKRGEYNLEIYPFPDNWWDVVSSMRLREKSTEFKARKELPFVLSSFAKLLGNDEVENAWISVKSEMQKQE
jgi:hypothetical protein